MKLNKSYFFSGKMVNRIFEIEEMKFKIAIVRKIVIW